MDRHGFLHGPFSNDDPEAISARRNALARHAENAHRIGSKNDLTLLDKPTLLADLYEHSHRMKAIAQRAEGFEQSRKKHWNLETSDYQFIQKIMRDSDPLGLSVIKFLDESWRQNFDVQLMVVQRNCNELPVDVCPFSCRFARNRSSANGDDCNCVCKRRRRCNRAAAGCMVR